MIVEGVIKTGRHSKRNELEIDLNREMILNLDERCQMLINKVKEHHLELSQILLRLSNIYEHIFQNQEVIQRVINITDAALIGMY